MNFELGSQTRQMRSCSGANASKVEHMDALPFSHPFILLPDSLPKSWPAAGKLNPVKVEKKFY